MPHPMSNILRIGILTLHDCLTEGGIVQAVALKKAVERIANQLRKPVQVCFINYQGDERRKAIGAYRARVFREHEAMPKDDKAPFRREHSAFVQESTVAEMKALHLAQHMRPLSFELLSHEEYHQFTKRLSLVLIGSDEIWKHDDAVFFGAHAACPVATYAACAPEHTGKLVLKYAEHLEKQVLVTTRDASTFQLAEQAVGSLASQVCDPSVLDWKPMSEVRYNPEAPLLSYAQCRAVKRRLTWAEVLEVEDTMELPRSFDPLEVWKEQPAIHDCRAVITNRFHPTHMGILASKPVISFDVRRKTVDAIEQFYGRQFAVNALVDVTQDLVREAVEAFDVMLHQERLADWKATGEEALATILTRVV